MTVATGLPSIGVLMQESPKLFSLDDLWSVAGYALLIVLGKVANPHMALAGLSLLAAGMLAVFWLASASVRIRTRYPDARVVFWALVAGASALLLFRG